jgi:hypothetical protein
MLAIGYARSASFPSSRRADPIVVPVYVIVTGVFLMKQRSINTPMEGGGIENEAELLL